ncbi:acyl-CoA thioesterase II [Sphingopyxis sp. JAI128]|uniref:acyl-CoA thioesterase n=1 Tax=Sphingopyxis sp. JAI128 TaxID=2723066 RepID=UPI001611066A|nr:acyl-CoA thioesterase domain-containing protein [Sphingopyxis sp. JAI128]
MGPRMFGGQAVAQAVLAAAGEEQDGKLVHSLHAHFLKAGVAADPASYSVSTLSDGRSFATRRIDARQRDQLIFSMTASFHRPETGFSHQIEAPLSLDIEAALQALDQWSEKHRDAAASPVFGRLEKRPIEIVPLDPGALFSNRPREARTGTWMRMRQAAPADPVMQRALLAYASDMMFLRNALLPHGIGPGSNRVQAASLDHAMWFHATPDFNDWLLYATSSPWSGHARGLNLGHFFARDGQLIATVTQESLMRPRDGGGSK